jgi:ParB-like chromosome segregation protein Spo0J
VGGGLPPSVKVPLDQLHEYPGNARIGDVDAIAESLKTTGQYKPVVVQASTNYVLVGNHTLRAAKKIGWKTLGAIYLDVDTNVAMRINLNDNRSNDRATYDTVALAEQLKKIDSYKGTGYSDMDVQGILTAIEERDQELISEVLRPSLGIDFEGAPVTEEERLERLSKQFNIQQSAADDANAANIDPAELERNEQIATFQHDLEGARDQLWPIENYWGIPALKSDMLMDTIPEPIDTWAGQEVTPDDGKTTWIWNFGLAASKGLPWDRALMAGFTYDVKFQALYEDPEFQFARLLQAGLRQSIVPDFSMWGDEPRFLQMQAVYRAAWVGRFMQEIGIKVMPRLMWGDPSDWKWCFDGIPIGAPCIAACFQAADPKDYESPYVAEQLRNAIRVLKPQALLVYSGNPGKRVVANALLPKSLHVVMVDNYAHKRRGVAYDKKQGKMDRTVRQHSKQVEPEDAFAVE